MANPNRVAGKATIKIDGQLFETSGGSTLDIGGATRENVEGDHKAGYFREKENPAKLTTKILLRPGVSAAQLRTIDNATLSVEFDTGQAYVIRNAYTAEAVEISSSDGTVSLTMMGPRAEEIAL